MAPVVSPSQCPFVPDAAIDPRLLYDPAHTGDENGCGLATTSDHDPLHSRDVAPTGENMPPPRTAPSRSLKEQHKNHMTSHAVIFQMARERDNALFESSENGNTRPINSSLSRCQIEKPEVSPSIQLASRSRDCGPRNRALTASSPTDSLFVPEPTEYDEDEGVPSRTNGRDAQLPERKRRRTMNRSSPVFDAAAIHVARRTDTQAATPEDNVIMESNPLLEYLQPVNALRRPETDLTSNPYAKALFDSEFPPTSKKDRTQSAQGRKKWRRKKTSTSPDDHALHTSSNSLLLQERAGNKRPADPSLSSALSPSIIADLLSLHSMLIAKFCACNNAVCVVGISPNRQSYSSVKNRTLAPPKLLHNIKINKLGVASHIVQMQEYEKSVCQMILLKKREYLRDQARQVETMLEIQGGIKTQKSIDKIRPEAEVEETQAGSRDILKILAELEGCMADEIPDDINAEGSDDDEGSIAFDGCNSICENGMVAASDAHNGDI